MWRENIDEIGLVKEINLSYNGNLEIKYALLKKDLSESKKPQQETNINCISYVLKADKLEKKAGYLLTGKAQIVLFFEKEGQKNPTFSTKKASKMLATCILSSNC